jgi:outer membrane protein
MSSGGRKTGIDMALASWWAIGFCAVALAGLPAAAADMKIGFVNTERVFREAAPAKKAQAILEKEFATRNADLARLEKQGRDLQTELEKETVTIPEAQRREKERNLADISRNFQRIQREIREDLNVRRNEELARVQERATRVINQIAEQEKFDLIVQEAVFASSRIDITDKVIKALADR